MDREEEDPAQVARQSTLINNFVERRNWAVVGASEDTSKYGNKIFRDLNNAGYHVYGINPKGGEIAGKKLYRNLAALSNLVKLDELVVDVVVPPSVTEKVVEECKSLGIKSIWIQPGAESQKAIQYCHDNNINVIHNACAMVRKRFW